jgi:hypothetical protein
MVVAPRLLAAVRYTSKFRPSFEKIAEERTGEIGGVLVPTIVTMMELD